LFVLGRVDDLIIIQGRNVYAHQVEALVSTIDGVKPGRVSAFGIHDSKVGSETLILVCEKNSSVEAISNKQIKTDIINIIFSTIEVIPKKIVLVEPGWLVKTSSGKVSRKENKAKYKRI
jgi:acyl-CoA synthetase (AMP-forming)/AMP-acid ligase II